MRQKTLEIQEIYKKGQECLLKAGIAEAALDAWYLLEHVTGMTKASYYGNPNREVSQKEKEQYADLIEKRSRRIPLQHLTKEQEFMGLNFYVNEHVLIPRQDTETLVEEALNRIRELEPKAAVLDMCTGSGCILISILKLCKREDITGVGVDLSEEALQVAEKNTENLNVEATYIQSDLFEDVPKNRMYDMIVSNPPYIRTSVIQELQEEVRLYDPYIALDGAEDGLYFYRRILKESVSYIKKDGWLIFEIGYDQAEDVMSLMKEAGYKEIRVKKDLAGLDRIVLGRYNEG